MKLASLSSRTVNLGTLVLLLGVSAYMFSPMKAVFDQALRNYGEPTVVSLSELEVDPNPDCWRVVLSGAQLLEVPATISADELIKESGVIPIGPVGADRDATSVKVFLMGIDSVDEAVELLKQESVQYEMFNVHESRREFLHEHYPETDWDNARLLSPGPMNAPLKILVACFLAFAILGFPPLVIVGSMLWQWRQNKKWAAKLDEPRNYADHFDAINLAGVERLGATRSRLLKRDHEIPSPEGEAKPTGFKSRIPGLILMLVALNSGNVMISSSGELMSPWFLGSLAGLIVSLAGSGYLMRSKLKDSCNVAPGDVLLDCTPGFAQLGWFQYHDAVLRELDFRLMGYLNRTGNIPVCRAIYLSHDGNVLVEVGYQIGASFICIETMLSDNSFIETHTLITPKTAVDKLQLAKLIRQAAKGMELLDVLDVHERSVRDALFATGAQEVELTEENYQAMLDYGHVVCTMEHRNRSGAPAQLLG